MATTVGVENVFGGVNNIRKELKNQEEYLGQIEKEISLMEEAWDSESQKEFANKFTQSRKELREFHNSLNEYISEIEKFAKDTSATDVSVFNSGAVGRIIFEGSYMREYSKNPVVRAEKLVEEAIENLKKANRHDGWQCAERHQINDELHGISSKLNRLVDSLRQTSSALEKGAEKFEALESRASQQEKGLISKLKDFWQFKVKPFIMGANPFNPPKVGAADKISEIKIPPKKGTGVTIGNLQPEVGRIKLPGIPNWLSNLIFKLRKG